MIFFIRVIACLHKVASIRKHVALNLVGCEIIVFDEYFLLK